MLRLFCLLILILHCSLRAQSMLSECDTCFKAKLIDSKDSFKGRIKLNNSILFDSTAIQKRKMTLLNKAFELKSNAIKLIDSSSQVDYKKKARSVIQLPANNSKSLIQNSWIQFKTKIPEVKKFICINGQIRSESYNTNIQNPLIRSERLYSRLYVSPTITLLGLPFTSNFFFTTEANNTYKNNFFSIRFDAEAMRKKATDKIQNEIDEAKKVDRLRQVDLQKYKIESENLQKQIGELEKQVPDIKNWKQTLIKEAENQIDSSLEKERQELETKLKDLPEEGKGKLLEKFKHKKDSMVNACKQNAEDSFIKAQLELKSTLDTSKINKYRRLRTKLEGLNSKQRELKELRNLDSVKLTKKTQGLRDPDDIKEMAKEELPSKKLLLSVLSIDRFGIGLVNPIYSDFTLSSASVKGLDIGVNKKNYFYDLTLGKTSRQFLGPFSNVLPDYSRNIGVARIGLGELKGDFLAVEYLYAFDQQNSNPLLAKINNGVANISSRFTLLKKLSFDVNLAQSNYKEFYSTTEITHMNSNPIQTTKTDLNKAYSIKAVHKLGELSKLEASFKQTGAGFRTVGNPFLRRNFREAEFRYEQQFFKKKLKLSAFYKEMRDNIYEVNTTTNRLKGYGLKFSTAFEKLPNLILSYSPYQQGNNHPDSLYRSNNQFSVTSAMLTYKKRWKGKQWSSFANYTRSTMELNGQGVVSYQMFNLVNTLQVGLRHSLMINLMQNVTGPEVDSLNSQSIQVQYNYLARKNLNIGFFGENTQFRNTAFKVGGGIQANLNFKRQFTIGIMARYDKVHGLWKLQDADVFTAKVVMQWRW